MEVFALFGARICSLGCQRRTKWAQGKFNLRIDGRVVGSWGHSHYAATAALHMSETNDCRPGRRICIMPISLRGGDKARGKETIWV